MLSLVGLVSYTLVLGTTLSAARPLGLDGSMVLCARAALDGDLPREILFQDESYAADDVDNERADWQRELDAEGDVLLDGDDEEVLDDVYEDRTESEWKKIERFMKRKLKVPKRYLKKIVRTLSQVASLRSIDGDGEMISIESPRRTGASEERLVLFDAPAARRYVAIIAAP